jgi:hypothetical protein
MDVFDILIKGAAMLCGVTVGGATMVYLFTIPGVIDLSALQVSQVYALACFGIMWFSCNIGAWTALFVRHVLNGTIA